MVELGVQKELRSQELQKRKGAGVWDSTGEMSELVAAAVCKVKQMLKSMAQERPVLPFCSAKGGFGESCLRCRALRKGWFGYLLPAHTPWLTCSPASSFSFPQEHLSL